MAAQQFIAFDFSSRAPGFRVRFCQTALTVTESYRAVVSGDGGARGILERNAERVGTVDFPEGELDLDTQDDLEDGTAL